MLAMDQPSAEAADGIMEGFSKTPLGSAWFGQSDQVLARMRQRLAEGNRFRGEFAYCAMIAAHHGDIDLAIDFLRAEYLVDGFGAWYVMWFPQLKQVRASPKFKTFLMDLGLPDMWRKTGSGVTSANRWGNPISGVVSRMMHSCLCGPVDSLTLPTVLRCPHPHGRGCDELVGWSPPTRTASDVPR